MQSRRQQLELARQQFDEGKSQFNRKMGFDEKSRETSDFWSVIDKLSGATRETKAAAGPMLQRAGIHEEDIPHVLSMLAGAPTNSQIQTERAVEQGMGSMSPDQQQRINQETASSRMTGMNLGQVAQGRNIEAIATRGQQMMQSADPEAAKAVQEAVVAQLPGWAQFQNVELGRGQLAQGKEQINTNAAIEAAKLAAQLNSAEAKGFLTADQKVQAIGQMRLYIDAMTKKGKNDATRMFDMIGYNTLARMIGSPLMTNPDEAPQAAGMLERMKQQFVPPQATTVQPSSLQPGPGATIPQRFNFQYNQTGPYYPQQNPLDALFPQGRTP